jgi:hypothetical protein
MGALQRLTLLPLPAFSLTNNLLANIEKIFPSGMLKKRLFRGDCRHEYLKHLVTNRDEGIRRNASAERVV